MKNIVWRKSAEIMCEVGLVKKEMIISVDDKIAERLVINEFEYTKAKATHDKKKLKDGTIEKEWTPIKK